MAEQMRRFDLARTYPERLVYVDPLLRKGFIPGLNPFDSSLHNLHEIEVYTQQLVQVFQETLTEARLSNFMKTILTPCVATLLHLRTCGFPDLHEFMKADKHHWLVQA